MELKLEKGTGVVTTIFHHKGFGFILNEKQEQIYFHASGVCTPEFEGLKEGYKVNYLVIPTPKGRKAIGITVY